MVFGPTVRGRVFIPGRNHCRLNADRLQIWTKQHPLATAPAAPAVLISISADGAGGEPLLIPAMAAFSDLDSRLLVEGSGPIGHGLWVAVAGPWIVVQPVSPTNNDFCGFQAQNWRLFRRWHRRGAGGCWVVLESRCSIKSI